MAPETSMTAVAPVGVDVATCEQEPIHIPGSVQPHGILLVLKPGSLAILQASANAAPILRFDVEDALGQPLGAVMVEGAGDLLEDVQERLPDQGNAHLRLVLLNGRTYNAIAHRADGMVVLELEKTDSAEAGSLDALYPQIRAYVDELQTMPTVEALNALAAAQVRRITGFDRVMIYRFDAQWNGTVVADALEAAGYRVEEAGSAAEGLAKMRAVDGRIDAAVVDIGLPDRKGDALAVEMRALRTDLPIIIASGYDGAETRTRFAGDRLIGFVGKPYESERLIAALGALGVAGVKEPR